MTAGMQERERLADRIYGRLKDALIYGEVETGAQLRARPLARRFGVSYTPVRDALHRLAWEKAIDVLPNGTFLVPSLGEAEIEELREQSKFFEGLLVEKAIPRLTDACIARVRAMWERSCRLAEEGRTVECRMLRWEARFMLFEGADSPWLLEFLRMLWVRRGPAAAAVYERFLKISMRWPVWPRWRLLEAVEARDIEDAKDSIARATDYFFDLWLDRRELETVARSD